MAPAERTLLIAPRVQGGAFARDRSAAADHARRMCRTPDEQDLTAPRDGLQALGVSAERIYVDHGLTGANHPGRSLKAPPDRDENAPAQATDA